MRYGSSLLGILCWTICTAALCEQPVPGVPNGSFEAINTDSGLPEGWTAGFGKGTQADIKAEPEGPHSGKYSVRITDQSPTQAYIYALFQSPFLTVNPETTYLIKFFLKGKNVGKSYVGAVLEGAGEHRQTLPVGDYDWQPCVFQVTTPAECHRLAIQFVADGISDAIWVDDVTFELSPHQFANLAEPRYPKDYESWFPCTPGQVPEHLVVCDVSRDSSANNMLAIALQGIVNRQGPQLYLINKTNPEYYDEVWLKYIKEKGYTGDEERIPEVFELIKRFQSNITGIIVYDPELPGSINAAWMLAGLKNALPAAPDTAVELQAKLGLKVVEDLRGRWKKNIEAYRHIYDKYWDQMSHHLLAWECPHNTAYSSRDTMVQHKVFTFWISAHGDREKGADPVAEEMFVTEILANTPGNVPVMGWPKYTEAYGVEEYTAVRLLSEFGKWVPGTGFNSNVSVMSAIHPQEGVFKQKFRSQPPRSLKLEKDKIYVAISVMDSGDAQWYFHSYQRKIWADPIRGILPIGFCMNMTLYDVMPPVAQWYYENMTPNESFFGLLYMNAPVYASRFRKEDRDRIWREYVAYMNEYCLKMDMDGIEIYNGGSGGSSVEPEFFQRFTRGMENLNYIFADLGHHPNITPENANYLVDKTAVFHTLTNFKVWTTGEEAQQRTMEAENAWLVDEIKANSPKTRPGFMSTLAISWNYFPTWFKDLQMRLPPEYVIVSPAELTRLWRENQGTEKAE
jgi:hypothetical protein